MWLYTRKKHKFRKMMPGCMNVTQEKKNFKRAEKDARNEGMQYNIKHQ